MLEKKHLVFLAGATAPFAPPLCTALFRVDQAFEVPVSPFQEEEEPLWIVIQNTSRNSSDQQAANLTSLIVYNYGIYPRSNFEGRGYTAE